MAKKKRITVDVPAHIESELRAAHADDGGGPSTRARLLLELWHDDAAVRSRVAEMLREERMRAAAERT